MYSRMKEERFLCLGKDVLSYLNMKEERFLCLGRNIFCKDFSCTIKALKIVPLETPSMILATIEASPRKVWTGIVLLKVYLFIKGNFPKSDQWCHND